jgi:integrase
VVKLADTTASKAVGLTSVGASHIDSIVFTYRNKPLKDIRTAFKNACDRAGIKNLRFHDLRHTFATRLVLAGVDLATVSKLLGHSTITMTMRYAHPTPEALKKAVSKLDEY